MQRIQQHKPDFIIIGAMKAATSAIYEYLMQHPSVTYRLPKELHFFTLNYDKGLDWYLSQFQSIKEDNKSSNLLIGEASPSYLTSKEAPALIYKLFPDVKIIISLRNPTDRAISHYYHQLNRVKDEARPIELAFSDREIENSAKKPYSPTSSYLELGKYATQIKNWIDVFPSEQMLILNYHDLEVEPINFVKKLFAFLALEDYQINNIKKIYGNQYPTVPPAIIERLDRYFKPYNQELQKIIDLQFTRIN